MEKSAERHLCYFVAAGTITAAWHASIGNVAAGYTYCVCVCVCVTLCVCVCVFMHNRNSSTEYLALVSLTLSHICMHVCIHLQITTGSVFAGLQSAGAAGLSVAAGPTIFVVVAIAVVGLGLWLWYRKSSRMPLSPPV